MSVLSLHQVACVKLARDLLVKRQKLKDADVPSSTDSYWMAKCCADSHRNWQASVYRRAILHAAFSTGLSSLVDVASSSRQAEAMVASTANVACDLRICDEGKQCVSGSFWQTLLNPSAVFIELWGTLTDYSSEPCQSSQSNLLAWPFCYG